MTGFNQQQSQLNGDAHPEQYGVTARYYDQVYADKAPEDLGFYLEQAGQCEGPVLELGCGTGRVTIPLAAAGYQVTGLDVSPAMLDRFESKLGQEPEANRQNIRLVHGTMSEFELGDEFTLVIAPFRAFQHLLTVEDQRRCLCSIRASLAPGGRFIFNAFNPNIHYMHEVGRRDDWTVDAEFTGGDPSVQIRRAYRVRHRMQEQIADIEWQFEICGPDGQVLDTQSEQMQLRWLYRFEAEHLLELCGFRIVAAYSDYDRSKLDEESKELIYVCESEQ